jgi:hypothetical protein
LPGNPTAIACVTACVFVDRTLVQHIASKNVFSVGNFPIFEMTV